MGEHRCSGYCKKTGSENAVVCVSATNGGVLIRRQSETTELDTDIIYAKYLENKRT